MRISNRGARRRHAAATTATAFARPEGRDRRAEESQDGLDEQPLAQPDEGGYVARVIFFVHKKNAAETAPLLTWILYHGRGGRSNRAAGSNWPNWAGFRSDVGLDRDNCRGQISRRARHPLLYIIYRETLQPDYVTGRSALCVDLQ